MGMYIRKSFRMGPLRFNLSKGGVGLSAGVKGARMGVNSKGRRYVHGGRHGLYYRKSLSGKSATARQAEEGGCVALLITVAALLAGIWAVSVFIAHPWIPLVLGVAALAGGGVKLAWRLRRRRRISEGKKEMDLALVEAESPPAPAEIERLRGVREASGLPITLRMDLYQAVLDRVLDDRRVTPKEAECLRAAEDILGLNQEVVKELHRELFSGAWMEAVADERITRDEVAWLEDLLDGLCLERHEVERELDVVNDLIAARAINEPLTEMEPGEISPHLQQSEKMYACQPARVLSRRGKGENIQWRVHRDGTLALTHKRLLVVGEGTTQLRLSDVTDVEVDLDEELLVVHKRGVGRPTWIRTVALFTIARKLEIARDSSG